MGNQCERCGFEECACIGGTQKVEYYNALLSVIAIVEGAGSIDKEGLQACLEAEGIGEFYVYAQTLLEITAEDDEETDAEEDDANPAHENDAEASEEE